MVNATGGTYLDHPSQADLVDAVLAAITTSFNTYHKVELAIAGLPAGIEPFFQALPASYTGDYTRDEERTFDFDVTLVGCCDAFKTSFDFEIDALVDGAIVAVEHDRWNCAPIPVPPSLILLGSGLLGLIGFRRFKLN